MASWSDSNERNERRRPITHAEENQQVLKMLLIAILFGVILLIFVALQPASAAAAGAPRPTPTPAPACKVIKRETITEGVERITCSDGRKGLVAPQIKPRAPQRAAKP